MAAGQWRVQ